ncbi:hypothetical protein AC26_3774 [Escherichia coli 1-176-05_S3_C2]|nr:hypothetical protein AC26_3774 [Escherichia coli 1-176-05_S3_C2]
MELRFTVVFAAEATAEMHNVSGEQRNGLVMILVIILRTLIKLRMIMIII